MNRHQPFAAELFFRYNENHDPDTGEFTFGDGGGSSGDGGGAPGAKTTAAATTTPSAGPKPAGGTSGYEFVSPSVADHLDFSEAVEAIGSSQQSALRDASLYINGALGVHAKEYDIVGAWADGAENSLMDIIEKSDWDHLVLGASMKGYLADQKQVLVFQEQEHGEALLYSFEAKGDLATIHANLLKDGLAFHTLIPHKEGATVYVADLDGSAHDAVAKGSGRYDAKVEARWGHAEFLGTQKSDGTDREQRDDARAAYEKNIGRSPVHDHQAIWQRVRDRWSENHQAVGTFVPGVKASGDDVKIAAVKSDWLASSPIKSIDDIVAAAKPAQDALGKAGRDIAAKYGVEFKDPGPKTKSEKGINRIKVKMAERGGNAARVTDVARASFIVDRPEQVDKIVSELSKTFEVTLENWRTTKLNYTDRAALIHFPNGLIGEVQFMDPEMANAKSDKGGGGHGDYVEWRQLDPKIPEQKARADALIDKMKTLYGDVLDNYPADWKAALGKSAT